MRALTFLIALVCTGCRLDLTGVGCIYPIDGSNSCSQGSQTTSGTGPATVTFRVPPGNTTEGVVITPAVEVVLLDGSGRIHRVSTPVALRIIVNPSEGTLGGTTTVRSIDGIAVFSDLTIDRPGVRYSLEASASGHTSVSSSFFDVAAKP